MIAITPADYAVTSLNTRFRIVVTTVTNATAPGVTFTYGLYPVSASAGGASLLNVTLGTVVAGSTVARATPSASTQNIDASADFALSSTGVYALGFVTSGATSAANSVVAIYARLEVHQV